MVEEACLRWPAIPDSANIYSNLDIMEVVHTRRRNVPNLSIVVASYWPEHPPTFAGAWRINFAGVFVYRLRSYGYAGNLPLTRLDQTSALWEIHPSNYFAQEDARKAALPDDYPVRRGHYVICTGANEVFEAIASRWSVEELGDEWAHPFSSPEPR